MFSLLLHGQMINLNSSLNGPVSSAFFASNTRANWRKASRNALSSSWSICAEPVGSEAEDGFARR